MLGLVAATLAVLRLALRTERTEMLTFTEPISHIDLDSDAGSVEVVAADRSDVALTRTQRYVARAPSVGARLDGGVLSLSARCPALLSLSCAVDHRLLVPRKTVLSLRVGAGNVDLADAAGEVTATTGAGGIHAAGSTGILVLRTGAGRVALDGTAGPVTVDDGAGSIAATGVVSGEVRARTGVGSVDLAFAAPPDRVEVVTSAGSIRIRVPPGPYRVDATSATGRVQVGGVVQDPTAPRSLTARATSGSVTITGP